MNMVFVSGKHASIVLTVFIRCRPEPGVLATRCARTRDLFVFQGKTSSRAESSSKAAPAPAAPSSKAAPAAAASKDDDWDW